MSLEDFPGWGGGGGGEKLGIRLNSAQLELEAWAELGKNGTYSIFSFPLFLVQKRLLKGKQKWKWKICKWYGCILLVPCSNLRIVKQFTMIANVWQWVIVLHFTELWTVHGFIKWSTIIIMIIIVLHFMKQWNWWSSCVQCNFALILSWTYMWIFPQGCGEGYDICFLLKTIKIAPL